MGNSKNRIMQLQTNINPSNQHEFYEYNKRNEFSTIWDDKKILEKKLHPKMITPNKADIIPHILPTTSSSYGAHHQFNINNKIFNY